MYKGRVPGVAAEVEQWFASTFDPELVRRQAGAGPRAPILVTPIPEVDELVPGVDALASGLCDALGRTVRGVTAARLFERVLLDALRLKDPGEANAPAGSSCCIIYISSRGELRYAGSHLIEKELWERHKNEFFELLRAGDARKLEALLRFLLKTRVNQHASTCRAGTAPDDMVDYFKEFKTSTEFKTSFRPAFAFYSKAGWSRAVFLHGVQYPAESRLIDVIGPDGDWFFNVNSAPVAGGNVWSFYVLDVDDVVRLSCHTLAATKKRVESWKRSTFKETMAKKPQHEKDAQQKQRLKTKAENLAPERLAREEAYQEPDDLVPVDLMPATVAVKELYLRGGCDQFGQKSIARSMGGAKAVKKRLVEKRAEMAAKRAAAAGLANPAAPRAPGAVVEEAPRRSSSRGSGRGPPKGSRSMHTSLPPPVWVGVAVSSVSIGADVSVMAAIVSPKRRGRSIGDLSVSIDASRQPSSSRTMPLEDGTNAEKEDPEPPLGWTSKDDIKDCKVYGQSLSPPCFKIMLFLKHYGIPFELQRHRTSSRRRGDADKERQEEITFGLQPAIEVDVLACAADFKKIALKAGFPVCSTTTFHGGDDPDQVDISDYGTVAPFHVGEGCVVEAHLADAGLAAWYEEMLGVMPIVD
ncbi:glutathione transferase [Aureococcus anophagefferens]|nr:glutathione transferase [Aureococcus anophagefferens]